MDLTAKGSLGWSSIRASDLEADIYDLGSDFIQFLVH